MDTDRRVAEGKPVAPSFLLACVLWQDVKQGWEKRLAKSYHPFPALQESIDEVFDHPQQDYTKALLAAVPTLALTPVAA